jgi:hypothetical protein
MLRNRLNDNCHRDSFVDAGCNVADQRGCGSMHSANIGKRMQGTGQPLPVYEQTGLQGGPEQPTPATACSTFAITPSIAPVAWLRRSELPSPIWASLVLGKA